MSKTMTVAIDTNVISKNANILVIILMMSIFSVIGSIGLLIVEDIYELSYKLFFAVVISTALVLIYLCIMLINRVFRVVRKLEIYENAIRFYVKGEGGLYKLNKFELTSIFIIQFYPAYKFTVEEKTYYIIPFLFRNRQKLDLLFENAEITHKKGRSYFSLLIP